MRLFNSEKIRFCTADTVPCISPHGETKRIFATGALRRLFFEKIRFCTADTVPCVWPGGETKRFFVCKQLTNRTNRKEHPRGDQSKERDTK